MKKTASRIQVGKNGFTEGLIERILNDFKHRENVKVEMVANKNKENVKKLEKEILDRLGESFSSRVIGFTINLKKSRKKKQ